MFVAMCQVNLFHLPVLTEWSYVEDFLWVPVVQPLGHLSQILQEYSLCGLYVPPYYSWPSTDVGIVVGGVDPQADWL